MSELMLSAGNEFFDKVFEENLNERIIVINDEISQDVVEKVILQIMKFNREDMDIDISERKKIRLYISSVGGDVLSGMGVVDAIRSSKTPIVGIVLTYAYSMGAIIFCSCQERIMFPTASVLIHDGQASLSGSANKVKDIQKFYNKLDDKVSAIIVANTNITAEEYEENKDRELYMFADECKEKGICHKIVGIDCTMDEIL